MARLQVPREHYLEGYDTPGRVRSYENQIRETLSIGGGNVLEIGIGNGFVNRNLKAKGMKVISVDIDPALNPNVMADACHLPFKDSSFDAVLCFEVLEHMPFHRSSKAMKELERVSREFAVISLPFSSGNALQRIIAPFYRHLIRAEHFWEIGWLGFGLRRILASVRDAGFEVQRHYRFEGNPYHYFIVARKVGGGK
ncbi:MAG: methyltransferase domain-containing protein [Candidatus Aenigmarchaeota archaeon]|nr:methyltransferase domain-containing protein [Candidatus Aenigmarchaeota archaeon]